MTAHDHPSPTLADAHRAACDEVNRWRGRCIALYAKIDEALAVTLDAMIDTGIDPEIERPLQFGPRLKAVRSALSGDRPLATSGAKVIASLEAVQQQLDQRNLLVHATGTVLLDQCGRWAWHYRFTPSGKSADRSTALLTQSEGEALETQLNSKGRSLTDQLANLQGALPSRRHE